MSVSSFGGYGYYNKRYSDRDPNLLFDFSAAYHILRDKISGNSISSTFSGTNRTYTDSASTLQTLGASTVRVDYVSGVPKVLIEGVAANILLGNPPTTQDLTLPTGSYTLQVSGAGTATSSAGTATITGAGAASDGTPNTFVVTVAGTVTVTIDTATVVWLTQSAYPSSYFAGAAAIGSELVTDGPFDVVTTGAAVSSGLLTVGNCYKIASRTDGDFVAAGAPDNNVGTYFNATTTGVGLLDAGDTVNPITLTNFIATGGWAPQAVAGALTGKAQKVAGTPGDIYQSGLTANKIYRVSLTISGFTSGTGFVILGTSGAASFTANGTYTFYIISNGSNLRVSCGTVPAFVIDDLSAKEHGTVRLTEAATVKWTNSAAHKAMLAGEFSMSFIFTPTFAKGASTQDIILWTSNDGTTKIYLDNANSDQISVTDGTNTATVATAYAANTEYVVVVRAGTGLLDLMVQEVGGSSFTTDDAGAYDGSFNPGDYSYPGYTMQAGLGIWIRDIKFYGSKMSQAYFESRY